MSQLESLKEIFPNLSDAILQQAISEHGSVEAAVPILLAQAESAPEAKPDQPVTYAIVLSLRSEAVLHDAVCDSCKERIVGIRFKSQKIPDYGI